MISNFIRKKNGYRYLLLTFIISFALISHIYKSKTVHIAHEKKEMHWGYPKSTPSRPRMR